MWIAIASVAQATAALALVCLTIRYVNLTEKLATASSEQLRRLDRAEIIGQLEPRGSVLVEYVLTNLGPAVARDVELRLRFGDDSAFWKYAVMRADQPQRFSLPGGARNAAQLVQRPSVLYVELRYAQAADARPQVVTQQIDCAEVVRGWIAAGWLQLETDADRLRNVVNRGLESIRAAIEQLSSGTTDVERDEQDREQ